MTRAPGLRRATVLTAVVMVSIMAVTGDVVAFLGLRSVLVDSLDVLLHDRAVAVQALADLADGPQDLIATADAAGIPVVLHQPDGQRLLTSSAARLQGQAGMAGTTVQTPHGPVDVWVNPQRVSSVLGTFLPVRAALTVLSLLAIAAALVLTIGRALRPLEPVTTVAQRVMEGERDARLRPKRTDTDIGMIAGAIDEMLDALEQAREAERVDAERQRAFLDDAAHQLRSPVAATRAAVEAMVRTTDPVRKDHLEDDLLRETDRSVRVVNALLRLARLDAGEPLRREPVGVGDLGDVCVAEADRIRPRVDMVHVDVDGVADVVELDLLAFREALANLLDNAARHARSQVELVAGTTPDQLVVRVADDGGGPPTAGLERLFGRFVSEGPHRGTGLGLPIARGIARVHGGDLVVEDGAFVIRLPRRS